ADFLSSGDLHAVDVAAIPNRLEDAVAEPENQNVLDSLFAEIVIDPVNLVFLENLLNLSIEFAGRFKIATERLLDHDASPVFRIFLREFHAPELLNDWREILRR